MVSLMIDSDLDLDLDAPWYVQRTWCEMRQADTHHGRTDSALCVYLEVLSGFGGGEYTDREIPDDCYLLIFTLGADSPFPEYEGSTVYLYGNGDGFLSADIYDESEWPEAVDNGGDY